jgi:hypothetical protein
MTARKPVSRKPSPKLPKVEFRHSWVYDQQNRLRFTDPLYPSGDAIRDYIDSVSSEWKSRARSVTGAITRLSGLPWREESIVCYVVGRGLPISDPLTMPVYEGRIDTFIEKLSYQLIERNILHPRNLLSRSAFWESMFRDMSSDGIKVSYLVPVNAVFREVQSRFFPGTNERESSLVTTNLDYQRAWEIVDSLGHRLIMERLRSGTWD